MTTFLRFVDETAARLALAEHLGENGEWPSYIETAAVDVVGIVRRQVGTVPEGAEPVFVVVPGWHINLSGRVDALQPYEIDPPATPDRVFAGDDVVEAPRVPGKVTRRQARQALLLAGLLDKVQPAINAIPDPLQRQMAQIEWDDSQDFERQRPLLIQLGNALGLDDAALDAIFIQAEGL